MIPSALVAQLERGMRDFLKASFWSNSAEFTAMLDRFIDGQTNRDSALFRGPFVSINLPFRTGTAGPDYFPDVPMEYPPYGHQQAAFERVGGDATRNTLVATGTGSGKTECFLFPILDYCRRFNHRRGIKAVLIYPMNALAQDQARRFAAEIWKNENLKSQVRAGLYVGSQERVPHTQMGPDHVITDKETIRQNKVDILLTNYKMLDYLLSRPRDQVLWEDNGPEALKYMVVDELHTFDGAQGTDLACLIRRLKSRLKTPENHLCCVGTSATLGGSEGSSNLVEYAEKIFGEPFDSDSVIGETRQRRGDFFDAFINPNHRLPGDVEAMDPEQFQDADAYIERQLELWFGDPFDNGLLDDDGAIDGLKLGATLKTHAFFQNLVRALEKAPQTVEELVERFRRHTSLADPDEPADKRSTRLVLTSLLALTSSARRPAISDIPADEWESYDGPTAPFVQTQIQLWQREMRRMVATVSNNPSLRHHDDLTREQRKRHLPVVYCRECGTMGWVTKVEPDQKQRLHVQLKALYSAYFSNDDRVRYFFPASTGLEGRQYFVDPDGLTRHREEPDRQQPDSPSLEKPDPVKVVFTDNTRKTQRGLRSHKDCPGCGAHDSLSLIGFQAATLSSTYINQLFASRFNDDKKVLTFSDSVQDAAHRAGFFGARTWRFNLRVAIQQVVDQRGDVSLAALPGEVAEYWREEMELPRWVATFIAPNMTWMDEWEALKESGEIKPDARLLSDIEKRLSWEIFGDYSLRSNIGRSLPRMGASTAYVPPDRVEEALTNCIETVQNEIGALRDCSVDELRPAVLGLLQRLLAQGAIFQPELNSKYIESGGENTYVMSQLRRHLPDFSPQSRLPKFVANRSTRRFEPLSKRSRGNSSTSPTWYETWLARNVTSSLLGEGMAQYAWELIFDALIDCGVLEKRVHGGTTVWGLAPDALRVTSDTAELRCTETGAALVVASEVASIWEGAPSTAAGASTGRYERSGRDTPTYFARMYSEGDVERIIADEHTGLLERDDRTELENQFKDDNPKPWYPNLLSCTPTLEMGIDVGDLSTAMLCSVPPSQANYLQRIGRAGRRDGNALLLTLANARNHDQYFFEQPREMIAGEVDQPGIFLRASAVLERQLTAFCMDCWAAHDDTTPQALPSRLGDALDNLEPKDQSKFPHNFIGFIKPRQTELFDRFIQLFQPEITDDVVDHLRDFLYGGDDSHGSLAWRILDGLSEQKRLIENNRREARRLSRRIKEWESQKVLGTDDEEALENARQERTALRKLNVKIEDRHTLEFFTDRGLIPNYTFPEAGVTLKSIIWRREKDDDGESNLRTVSYEYERPARAAIRELAPHNTFYAGGRQVTIDRVDLSPDTIEQWQFCDQCNYAEKVSGRSKYKDCPACQSPQFGDIQAQRRPMVRLRRVYASTKERASLITDDSEQRRPRFYQKQMLVSVEDSELSSSMAIDDESMPFGYDFVGRAKFTELNCGEFSDQGEKFSIANVEAMRHGFQVCKDCGRVKDDDADDIHHTYGCRSRNKTHDERLVDCLFLYREFSSEAVRVLLPFVDRPGYQTKLQSLVAALNLGLEEYFGGQIGHLETTVYSEPGDDDSPRKTFLVLYDTVPGGTGYIKDLLGESRDREGPAIFAVLEDALHRLKSCECRHDPEKDGCYACLFAYRNSYDMNETSRSQAVELLSDILEYRDELVPVDSLGAVNMSGLFDSALEARLVEAIRRRESVAIERNVIDGKPAFRYRLDADNTDDSPPLAWELIPQVGVDKSAHMPARMEIDLLARAGRADAGGRDLAIFTDGYRDHSSRIGYDFFQRMALMRGGNRYSWSLTWHDVESVFQAMDRFYFNALGATDQGFNRAAMENLAAQLGVGYWVQSQCDNNSMAWLNDLLGEAPEDWEKTLQRAAMAAVGGGMLAPFKPSPDDALQQWQNQLGERIGSEVAAAIIPEDAPRPIVNRLKLTDEAATMEIYALWTHRGIQETSPREMRVVVWLDDRPELRDQPEFRHMWNGALRLMNLLQFLPRSYFITSSGGEKIDLEALVAADLSTDDPAESTRGLMSMDWKEVRQEMLDEDKQLVDALFEADAPLPEPVFPLLDDQGHTLGADAELAWPDLNVALVYVESGNIQDEQAMDAFKDQGWTTRVFQEMVEAPEELIELLDDVS